MTDFPSLRAEAEAERLLKEAWLDGFNDEHVRYIESAWRHSATCIAIAEGTHPLAGRGLTPPQLAALYPQAAESIRIAFPEAFASIEQLDAR